MSDHRPRTTRSRAFVATRPRPPVYVFEPSFVREQLQEARDRVLQEEEGYGYRAGVGTGDDDWTGSVNE